jgi:hypothetical protein
MEGFLSPCTHRCTIFTFSSYFILDIGVSQHTTCTIHRHRYPTESWALSSVSELWPSYKDMRQASHMAHQDYTSSSQSQDTQNVYSSVGR